MRKRFDIAEYGRSCNVLTKANGGFLLFASEFICVNKLAETNEFLIIVGDVYTDSVFSGNRCFNADRLNCKGKGDVVFKVDNPGYLNAFCWNNVVTGNSRATIYILNGCVNAKGF